MYKEAVVELQKAADLTNSPAQMAWLSQAWRLRAKGMLAALVRVWRNSPSRTRFLSFLWRSPIWPWENEAALARLKAGMLSP